MNTKTQSNTCESELSFSLLLAVLDEAKKAGCDIEKIANEIKENFAGNPYRVNPNLQANALNALQIAINTVKKGNAV